MMRKIVMTLGLAACVPLLAGAATPTGLETELNGLDIDVQTAGAGTATGAGPGAGVSDGPQALMVTNNSDVAVSCELEPGPTDTLMDDDQRATIEPGESATMRLSSGYASATVDATLRCNPQD